MIFLEYDVLVIGAGAAGLISAYELACGGKKVAVIEAKDKIGGRITTVERNGYSVELGAEFIHGNLPLTQALLKKAGAQTYPVEGKIWQYKNDHLEQQESFIEDDVLFTKKLNSLSDDKSVMDFLREDLEGDKFENLRSSVRNYVEGYYAADTSRASAKALGEEWLKGDEEQYRIEGGYQRLINYLEKQCIAHGVTFLLSHPVLEIRWKKDQVNVLTDQRSITGKKAVITVSMGVLQRGSINFQPALPSVLDTVQKLGYGHAVKLVCLFQIPFWKEAGFARQNDLADLGFLFSEAAVPTWWTHFPKGQNILTGWIGGPKAKELQSATKDELQRKALHSLSHIFSLPVEQLHSLLDEMMFYNWSADPHFCGAYSYEVVGGGEMIQKMLQPVEETLFFAGEGLQEGPLIGTVEGALQSGKKAAHQLLSGFELEI